MKKTKDDVPAFMYSTVNVFIGLNTAINKFKKFFFVTYLGFFLYDSEHRIKSVPHLRLFLTKDVSE